jgi:general L-amino acid transport system permease protein
MSQVQQVLRPMDSSSLLTRVKKNLFNSWGNSILTILASIFIFWLVRGLLAWVFTEADWSVIWVNLRLFLVGQYPIEEVWRVWLSMGLLAFLVGNSISIWAPTSRGIPILLGLTLVFLALLPFGGDARLWIIVLAAVGALGWWLGRTASALLRRIVVIGWIIWPPIFILLLRGLAPAADPLTLVSTNLWGGLLLTFLLTVVGIVFSFPLGVLLALGRRSNLPVVRWFSVGYIEIIRGVPLITILFMAQLMLPLFLPAELTVDRVLRAMVGITLFSAAYLAENVRGGLQSIPRGQYEAAYALGLNGIRTMGLIILPQALRLVIPILTGQFIALFKDTALVSIVGLLDLLGIARTVLAQPDFLGLQREVYAFISLLYWILSYGMSYVSQRLEVALGSER